MISKIKCPVLIIHGTKDSIVSLEDGELLSKAVNPECLYEFFVIQNGDHNDLIKNHKSIVFKKLREFLHHIGKLYKRNSFSENVVEELYDKFAPIKEMHEHFNLIESLNEENKEFSNAPIDLKSKDIIISDDHNNYSICPVETIKNEIYDNDIVITVPQIRNNIKNNNL